jgi:hypothetical protein
MDRSHTTILHVVLMAICIQGADVTLKPGNIMALHGDENASSTHDVHHYVIKIKLR